ncbi:MAG: methylmalonyl-CoA mutase family protein, partial [candidate division NC10 bacterium]
TVQNDILKEYVARGTYIYPPKPSLRLATDLFAYCHERVPKWNTISISGYHIREAGSTAAQELAFTLADGFTYVEACLERGLDIDAFAPRLSFFWNSHLDFFEEIAKLRAARRIWARHMRERYGAKKQGSWLMRFHTQTAGCSLWDKQPENNIVRTAFEALAGVLGGTQSLHTNSMDETIALPSDKAVKIALRTQQIIAHEIGVTETIDPLAGSYYLESLTDEMERGALEIIGRIRGLGGVILAIEKGFFHREIAENAYRHERDLRSGRRKVVGVNCFQSKARRPRILKIHGTVEARQVRALKRLRRERDNAALARSLNSLEEAARGADNLMPPILECVKAYGTLGEAVERLKAVFGEYTLP